VTRSRAEREEDEQALLEARTRESEERKRKAKVAGAKRHSRFGGTFVVSNVKSISDQRHVISHQPLRDLNDLNFDREKRSKKVARNKKAPAEENAPHRSTLSIRLFLKEFCIEFLVGAYNSLMSTVKDNLVRQRAQQNDESYYLWAIR